MADLVKLEKVGSVYILTLLGEGEHRLNESMFEAIILALETVQNAEDAAALVTTNEGRFYSNGFDMDWLNAQDYSKGAQSRYNLSIMLATLMNMNVPTIAAICGHTCAAGVVTVLAHDHRCMRGDRGFLYMSEMEVKVRIPIGTMSLMRAKLSPKAFKDMFLLAKKHTANDAYNASIVDSVHENSAETLKAAIAWATQLSKRGFGRDFYRNARLDMHPNLVPEFVGGSVGTRMYREHPELLSKL